LSSTRKTSNTSRVSNRSRGFLGRLLEAGSRVSNTSWVISLDASSEPASAQPCSSSAADDLGLEMCVDDIDESEDENNEVLVEVDDSDTD